MSTKVQEGLEDVLLAVMSSSRSGVVTKCVHLCVRVSIPFFLLVSFESIVHLACHKTSKYVKGTPW